MPEGQERLKSGPLPMQRAEGNLGLLVSSVQFRLLYNVCSRFYSVECSLHRARTDTVEHFNVCILIRYIKYLLPQLPIIVSVGPSNRLGTVTVIAAGG